MFGPQDINKLLYHNDARNVQMKNILDSAFFLNLYKFITLAINRHGTQNTFNIFCPTLNESDTVSFYHIVVSQLGKILSTLKN